MFFGERKQRYMMLFIALFPLCTLVFVVVFDAFNKAAQVYAFPQAASDSAANLALGLQTPIATQPSARPKVFVIGLSKTGTTSLGDALASLSYRRLGWEDIRSRFLFVSYKKQDISPLIALTHFYDAFEDLPWALAYKEMALLYPDAKFILTLRKSEAAWLRSIKSHTARRQWKGHENVYGADRAEGHEAAYLAAYRRHTDSVREFFGEEENEGRLLEFVIDIADYEQEKEDEQRWNTLLNFLDMDAGGNLPTLGEFPRSNPSDSWINRDPWIVWWYWDQVIYYGEDVLLGGLKWLGWLCSRMP